MKTLQKNPSHPEHVKDDFYHDLCALLDTIIQEDNPNTEMTVEALGWRELKVQQVYKKIKVTMKENNIPEAERLREMLFQIDATATSAIFKAGKLIEDAKLQLKK